MAHSAVLSACIIDATPAGFGGERAASDVAGGAEARISTLTGRDWGGPAVVSDLDEGVGVWGLWFWASERGCGRIWG